MCTKSFKKMLKTFFIFLGFVTNPLTAAWQMPPQQLVPIQFFGEAFGLSLAYSDEGTGLIVGTFMTNTASYKFNGTSWESPVVLLNASSFSSCGVAMDTSGNGLAVFSDPTNSFTISASRYNHAAEAWFDTGGSCIPLSTNFSHAPSVVMSPQGNGLAAFIDNSTKAFASQYNGANNTWSDTVGSAIQLSTNGNPVQGKVYLGMDAFSNGLAVWNNNISGTNIIQSANYNGSTKLWTNTENSAINLSLGTGLGGNSAGLAMSLNGTALAVWIFGTGSGLGIESSWYDGSSWQHTGASAITISETGVLFVEPAIAMDSSGNGFAVWASNVSGNDVVKAARFDSTTQTWGEPIILSSNASAITKVQASCDAAGNAYVGWILYNGVEDVAQSAYYNSSTKTWQNTLSTALPISDPTESCDGLILKANSSGKALAAFNQGVYPIQGLFANFNPGPQPQNGSAFVGVARKDKFLTQIDNVHILNWTASNDPTVIGYIIRSHGLIQSNIPANDPLTVIYHNQIPKVRVTYTLTSYNNIGVESNPLTVTIN